MRVFIAAATSPTFREAATRLGVSPRVVTRVVRELEEALGETLFHRSTRRVQITAFGRGFADQAQQALASIDASFEPLIERTDEPLRAVRGISAHDAENQKK
jgi:DNA-binding transcriptional LysR family regulator